MFLDLYDNHFKVVEIRICQGKVQVIPTDSSFSAEETEKLQRLLSTEPLLVFANGRYCGRYNPTDPDYIIGVKIVLGEDYNPELRIDDSPTELLQALDTIPKERQWRFAFEIVKANIRQLGLLTNKTVERALDAIEEGRVVDFLSLAHLLVRFEDELDDQTNSAAIEALLSLVPVNPLSALRQVAIEHANL
ncbi:hypothetical protein A2962_05420 [Candidatus Woesebacteria bacterium RIFCSPLOWO2_01_FULL_39_61]|uniref:Uncharacterized protein n=1 Tax=Candidatus Woesebacteria bacterium RIFCSPHIGHO2_02_FULL_39_13 TaxID=1802505 RepID=A0A1F7Z522_9BACT|nr:MAG: hypothetical protein A2692_00735 [Candidatus Woesebacteria bacterium RIFCSPHIGHO2_01_FULL_39_95]OGM34647.1 MAG: hypothetical protein A3D01_06425 [Candidatus Woesebacteria bacterium RIFCSPHIGHO2_02_FULL_39_13]OGM37389.1 MAG: hypothetical protein A3E13_05455 [Candidatus Woesebacteria bacterium RIFCSPHIGHO2_12_FULL_40_20]OGM68355.1 MAG: hypothetical protein A2962_05420 [Candidatus Woesebacteria bacterium RIFCSPLOWO2_01_FULL_39_61]OGM71887.1 MAG: hypothetical protein A3H19_05420 [Candidatus